MPPRLNKRQLREVEELQALEATPHSELIEADDSEDGNILSGHNLATGFAALAAATGIDNSQSEEEDVGQPSKSKKKKKKKKASDTSAPKPPEGNHSASRVPPSSAPSGTHSASKKERKALKKQRAKAAKDDEDDLDKALATLSIKYPELKRSVQGDATAKASPAFISLLQVSLSHLDSEAEMRKFFGARVISASKASFSGSSSPARRQMANVKSSLTRPQPTWWPSTYRQGLSARLLSDEEMEDRRQRHGWSGSASGEKVWTIEYSRKYRGITKTFMQMVMSGDPEGLFHVLRSFPYHADTLLQLSEVYSHREEHSTAADFIDRALFTYERAFVGSFNFTSGLNRLDFDRVENRPFFLAVHRQISDLQRRGCVRTAFEYARLLYSLDPSMDPHGALLHLDYLSIKAGMSDWLLELWDAQCSLPNEAWKGRIHVRALPGCAYSRALALFVKEESKHDTEHLESTNALLEAVNAFPSVVPLLADKADIPLISEIRSHPSFRIHTDSLMLPNEAESILHLLSHLYALRSSSLWKVKSRSAWFISTLNAIAKTMPPAASSPPTSSKSPSPTLLRSLFSVPTLRSSIYRHVLVLEASTRQGRLFGFIPTSVISGKQLACDPLPPPSRVSEYNAEFFQGAEDPLSARPRGRRDAQRLLERLVPDPVFRRQLQDFFEAHPHFAQRFPGGIVEFAQIAGQLPEEMLEDLMIAEVAAGQGRAMPGQMPREDIFADAEQDGEPLAPQPTARDGPVADEEVDSEEDTVGDEADDEEDIDVAPLPVRILRHVMNRFWRTVDDEAESSEEDGADAVPQDDQGVD